MRAFRICASLAVALALPLGLEGTAGEAPVAPESTPTPASPSVPAAVVAEAPLDSLDRATLLRLAWQTLVGHLTNHPIQDSDLERYDLSPRLLSPRGCFVTLTKGGETRGNQGEIDATRPLYQQVIVFTRRAATRDPRFLPLTERDLGGVLLRIEVIGTRRRIEGPAGITGNDLGVFLEKWGRRALFLPGVPAAAKWSPEKTLDELCRQAALPAGAWKQGARLEVFATDVVEGPEPPPTPTPSPAASPPPPAGPAPPEGP